MVRSSSFESGLKRSSFFRLLIFRSIFRRVNSAYINRLVVLLREIEFHFETRIYVLEKRDVIIGKPRNWRFQFMNPLAFNIHSLTVTKVKRSNIHFTCSMSGYRFEMHLSNGYFMVEPFENVLPLAPFLSHLTIQQCPSFTHKIVTNTNMYAGAGASDGALQTAR